MHKKAKPEPAVAARRKLVLSDLKQVAAALRQLRQARQQQEAQEKLKREAAELERELFRRSVGPVQTLKVATRAPTNTGTPVQPLPLQLELDERRALLESISDDFDVSSLLETDEALSYCKPGVARDVARKLRLGHWSIQATLDLHGMRLDQARETLGQFIRQHHRNGTRCIRIVHGKGHGSPGRIPVLKTRVQRWLVQKNEVLAFVQAKASEGGSGAVLVLLDRAKKQA